MREAELEVAKAYPNDSGRGIARLDPDTLLHLKLSPEDIIEIEGAETTVAQVWRLDKKDWNNDTIRIDGFTRSNADVGIGERVTIRKAETTDADRVVLAPPEGASAQFGSDALGMVKGQILERPVVQGDVLLVMSSTNHPSMRLPGQAIPLIAAKAEPDRTVIVTEETEVVLREKPHQPDESDIQRAEKIVLKLREGSNTELDEDEVRSYRDSLLSYSRPIGAEDEISINDSLFVVLETEPEEAVRPTERTDIVFDSGDSRILVSGISLERQETDTEDENGT